MPLQRVNWAENQRVDDVDLNRTNQFAAVNLALVLRHFLAPGFGIVRGGLLRPAGGMFCELASLAAVAQNGAGTGLIVLENPVTVGPFAANGGGSTRTDMVSIRYVETPATEARAFINPDTDTEYTNPTAQVTFTATPTVVITPGSTTAPAGDIAVATVQIAPGQTVINSADVTTEFVHRAHPYNVGTIGEQTVSVPWESSVVARHRSRGPLSALFIASVQINCAAVPENVALRLEIFNGDVPVGSSVFVTPPSSAAMRLHTAVAIGISVDGAPSEVRDYTLQLRREDGNTLAAITIVRGTLACLSLGSPFLGGV